MRGGEICPGESFRSYIQPRQRRPISDAARAVHRINDSDLVGAPDFMTLWPELKRYLSGRIVVAHGAGTEKRFLRAFPLHGFKDWIDTLAVARRALPGEQDYSLGSLIERLDLAADLRSLCPDLDWHDALFDAVASRALLKHIVQIQHLTDVSTLVR